MTFQDMLIGNTGPLTPKQERDLETYCRRVTEMSKIDVGSKGPGNCSHGISLSASCPECARDYGPLYRERISDWDRIDYIERRLQVPAQIKRDDGTTVTVTSWALVGPLGLTLRETIDGLIKGEALAKARRAAKHDQLPE